MTKLEYLKTAKAFLRKVIDHRRTLLHMHAGRPDGARMAAMMAEIEYRLPYFVSFDAMAAYLAQYRVQIGIREIIPSNKTAWIDQFNSLVKDAYMLTSKKVMA